MIVKKGRKFEMSKEVNKGIKKGTTMNSERKGVG
jgi:hypothetical protein